MGLLVLVGLSIILSFVVRETRRALIPVQKAKRQPGKNHSVHKELISDLHAEFDRERTTPQQENPIGPFGLTVRGTFYALPYDVQRCRAYEPTILREPCRLARVGPYRARCDRSSIAGASCGHRSASFSTWATSTIPAGTRSGARVTATTARSPRWCCREPCAATTRARCALHHHQPLEGRGKALYEKYSGPEREPDRRHGPAGHGPRLLAVAGKPASCT